jgi:hypothetical protein
VAVDAVHHLMVVVVVALVVVNLVNWFYRMQSEMAAFFCLYSHEKS